MKKTRFTETQIISAIKQHESLEGKTPIQMEENSYKSKQINNYFVNSNPV
jgi:hypothetical protein